MPEGTLTTQKKGSTIKASTDTSGPMLSIGGPGRLELMSSLSARQPKSIQHFSKPETFTGLVSIRESEARISQLQETEIL
jgi:hypothetical protein